MNIVITGFMATGKTEISKQLSKMLGYNLVDTDAMVVEAQKMSINEIFAKYGEAYFRKLESEAAQNASEMQNTVISTGGGTVLDKRNMEILRKNGIVVNLSADFSLIKERLQSAASTRPLLRDSSVDEIEKRFNDRLPFYNDCDCKIKVSNDNSPEEHAKMIIEELKNKGFSL